MIYLASPYSHSDKAIVEDRVYLTMKCTAALIKQKLFVWSPIVHCHAMAKKFGMPTDAAFWMEYNFDFIRRAEAVYLLKIDGWDKSAGVTEELTVAKALFIPIRPVNEFGIEIE